MATKTKRLTPQTTVFGHNTFHDFVAFVAQNIESALIFNGAVPGKDYSQLDLVKLALPFALKRFNPKSKELKFEVIASDKNGGLVDEIFVFWKIMKCGFLSIVTLALFVGLVGCGNVERRGARQKFKEMVAAIKIRTQGSNYSEFRQAELDLKASYVANKEFLDDVLVQFENLDLVLSATDYFWSLSIKYPNVPVNPRSPNELSFVRAIKPDTNIMDKLEYNYDQKNKDPDFYPKNYVRTGLKKIDDQAAVIMNLLGK